MQTENGRPGLKSEWIGNLVFDAHGYLMGQVIRIDEDARGDYSLVVAPPNAKSEKDHFSVDSRSLTEVDPQTREIHTNFDYRGLVSDKDQWFQLLEERLVVNRKRVKKGEVIVRKVTETQMVEVPVYREKLVVQKQGEDSSLFEMPLGETHWHSSDANLFTSAQQEQYVARGHLQNIQDAVRCFAVLARSENTDCRRMRATLFLKRRDRPTQETTQLEFENPGTAANLLGAIAPSWSPVCEGVGLELCVVDEVAQARYQAWFDEYTRVISR